MDLSETLGEHPYLTTVGGVLGLAVVATGITLGVRHLRGRALTASPAPMGSPSLLPPPSFTSVVVGSGANPSGAVQVGPGGCFPIPMSPTRPSGAARSILSPGTRVRYSGELYTGGLRHDDLGVVVASGPGDDPRFVQVQWTRLGRVSQVFPSSLTTAL